jgi:hypothetical protein
MALSPADRQHANVGLSSFPASQSSAAQFDKASKHAAREGEAQNSDYANSLTNAVKQSLSKIQNRDGKDESDQHHLGKQVKVTNGLTVTTEGGKVTFRVNLGTGEPQNKAGDAAGTEATATQNPNMKSHDMRQESGKATDPHVLPHLNQDLPAAGKFTPSPTRAFMARNTRLGETASKADRKISDGSSHEQLEHGLSGDTVKRSPPSLEERRDQVSDNNQDDELSVAIAKNMALATVKTLGSAVDTFGKIALPSLFGNKFIRSAVSQTMERAGHGQGVMQSEIEQLAADIVGEMIDSATFAAPRQRAFAKANILKDAVSDAIRNTLIDVATTIPIPGKDQTIQDVVVGILASRILENAQPDNYQPSSDDRHATSRNLGEGRISQDLVMREGGSAPSNSGWKDVSFQIGSPAVHIPNKQTGNLDLLRNTTVESILRNSVEVTAAIGNIGKALLSPVGTVLNESTKASITFGVAAISVGLLTGNFRVLHFDSQGKNLSPEAEQLSKIINQPKNNPITAIQVDTPFVDPKYGSKTSLWIDTHVSAGPEFLPTTFLPGQEGQVPWAAGSNGRLRLMNLAAAGNINLVVGITTGTKNVASNEYITLNTPSFQPQLFTDVGSSSQRKSPIDATISFFATPCSVARMSEYIFGPGRAFQGAVISPNTPDVTAGTKGVGFKKMAAGLDVIPFAGMSPNSSFDPNDQLYNDIMKPKDQAPDTGGKKEAGTVGSP